MSVFYSFSIIFFICSINPASIFSIWNKKNIHALGSKNPGSTNAYRVFGAKTAAIVFIIDYLKPLVAFSCLTLFMNPINTTTLFFFPLLSIAGHCFSPFLNFQGGKGIATYFGSFLAFYPQGSVLAILFWIMSYALTTSSWKASLISCALLIVFLPKKISALCLLPTLIIFIRHKNNLKKKH